MHGNEIKRGKRLALLVLLSQLLGCGDDSPATAFSASEVKQLTEGQVTGIDSPFDGAITVFRGLPYAEPPVGDLRWQAPQPPATWSGVRVADTFADSCHQPRYSSSFVWRRDDFSVSEDCLYLNVWAPERAEKLPVMVWFHGG